MATKSKRSTAQSKRRIFVVEDHPVFCEGLVRLISGEKDLTVCGKAGDAEKAFKEIRHLKPDLAVIDLGLPGSSGLDLIKQLRALKLPLKLLVVSMYDEAIYAQRVLRAGGDGYVMKEEDPSEIIHAIRDVLNGRIYVSEEILAGGAGKQSSPSKASLLKASSLEKLTDSELQLLESLGEGMSDEEMAQHYRMTAGQVSTQCRQIQQKLGLNSLNALIRYAVCWVEDIPK
jgi:DNA-binding NarL/FixJ family response regulator